MKLSEKRKTAVYSAIHEQIVQARLQIAKQPELQSSTFGALLDFRLAQLVTPIYRDVLAALIAKEREGR